MKIIDLPDWEAFEKQVKDLFAERDALRSGTQTHVSPPKRVTTSWLIVSFGAHGMGLLPATLGIGSKGFVANFCV
jgi:hypothetical protein